MAVDRADRQPGAGGHGLDGGGRVAALRHLLERRRDDPLTRGGLARLGPLGGSVRHPDQEVNHDSQLDAAAAGGGATLARLGCRDDRDRPLLVLALALIALMAAAPSADARRKVPHGFFGTMWGGSVANAPDEVQEEQWALMARTGVESVRTVFSWSDAQSTPDAAPNFERTDRVVRLAAARGMQLLPVVIETPPWARAFDHPASPPRSNADLAAYLTALVRRYGPNGSFWTEYPVLPKRPIRTWQLYNEPHLPYFWHAERGSRYAWPRGYVALLKAGRRALRSADRRAKVVLAGLTNDSWNHLLRLYRRGARRHFDIAAIQTYSGSPRRAMRAIFLFRRAMRRYRDARKPIWATRRAGRRRRGACECRVA